MVKKLVFTIIILGTLTLIFSGDVWAGHDGTLDTSCAVQFMTVSTSAWTLASSESPYIAADLGYWVNILWRSDKHNTVFDSPSSPVLLDYGPFTAMPAYRGNMQILAPPESWNCVPYSSYTGNRVLFVALSCPVSDPTCAQDTGTVASPTPLFAPSIVFEVATDGTYGGGGSWVTSYSNKEPVTGMDFKVRWNGFGGTVNRVRIDCTNDGTDDFDVYPGAFSPPYYVFIDADSDSSISGCFNKYYSPGNYKATATVSDTGGFSVSSTLDINVLSNPAVNLTCDNTAPRIGLTWSAYTGATNYQVLRNGSFYRDVGLSTSFTDDTVSSGTNYAYRIVATHNTGYGFTTGWSNAVNLKAQWCVGDIDIKGKKDGADWSYTGAGHSYDLKNLTDGSVPLLTGFSFPTTFFDKQYGDIRLENISGPPGVNYVSTTPNSTLTISRFSETKPKIALTMNFVTPPDFSLSVTPTNDSVQRPNPTTFQVTVTCLFGFAGPVNGFDLGNLHNNATFSFSPSAVSCGGSTTLTVNTTSTTAPVGVARTLTISGNGVGVGTRTITANLTVTVLPRPTIDLTCLSGCSFTALQGTNPASQILRIKNTGTAPLAWSSSITQGGGWLSISPAIGIIAVGGFQDVTINVSSSSLVADNYNGNIRIFGFLATNTPQNVPVALTVTPPPTLAVDVIANPSSGSAPLSSELVATVSGTASGPYVYAFWWNCPSATGANLATAFALCGDPDGVGGNANGARYDGVATLSQDTPNKTYLAGTYTGKVIVQSSGGQTAEDTVTITSTAPIIGLSCTNSCDFNAVQGGTNPTQTFTISNTGNATLNWSRTITGAWLSVSGLGSGAIAPGGSQDFTATANVGILGVATYSGNIRISDPSATNSPQDMSINFVISNASPSASSIQVIEPDYCLSGPGAVITWTFLDPGDTQSSYQVQIDNSSSFTSPEWDSGSVAQVVAHNAEGSHNTASFGICQASNPSGTGAGTCRLTWNTGGPAYQARVRVWDSGGLVSGWVDQTLCTGPGCQGGGDKWKTPRHPYPQVNDFGVVPPSPNAGQSTQFTDATVFTDTGGGPRVWNWNFGDGSPNSSLQNPAHIFASPSIFSVTETVTDKQGYTCARSKPVTVQEKVPVWKEIPPK